jgi:ABC-2 type transport system ATP-binding protein
MTMVQPQRQEIVHTGETKVTSSEKSVVVNGLGKSFGDVQAVRGISFEVGRGEVVALLGPNGAGKTTTVDMLSTLTKPDRGSASIAGFDVVADPAAVRRVIMLTGQQVALDDVLTGRENLLLFGRLQGLTKSAARSRAEELLQEFDLQYAAERRVGTYSGGMRRRIDIACGLVVRPEVVFLDEPTTGLDPRSRQAIWDLVASFKNLGISTLLTSQYLEEADALSDRIIVIDHGEIVAQGTSDELKERTGGSYCEIVPRDLNDLPAVVAALGPLMPEKIRAAALASESDRIAMPAPRGPNTLVEALALLNTANIELRDIALRRPSLDDVFLALTSNNAGSAGSNGSALEGAVPNGSARGGSKLAADEQQPDIPIDTDDNAQPSKGGARSWVSAHARTLVLLVVCVIVVTVVSLFVLNKDSAPAGGSSDVPAVVQAPHSPAPAAPVTSMPAAPPASAALPPAAPVPAEAPAVAPTVTRAQSPVSTPFQSALPTTQAPRGSAVAAISPPTATVTAPAVAVSPSQMPTATPAGASQPPQAPVEVPHMPLGALPGPVAEQAPLPPAEVPAPPPDPVQAVMSPILGGLP